MQASLGGPAARLPGILNTGVVLMGLAGIAAGFGFFFALRRLTGALFSQCWWRFSMVLFAVAMVMGGLFPMLDPRHGAYGLGMAINLGPILLAAALWKQKHLRRLTIYLMVTALFTIAFFAIMMGVGGLVTRANVGVYQRLYALCTFPWIGVASYALSRELGLLSVRADARP